MQRVGSAIRNLMRGNFVGPHVHHSGTTGIMAMIPAALTASRFVTRDAGTRSTANTIATNNVLASPAAVRRTRGNRPCAAIIIRDGGAQRAEPAIQSCLYDGHV